MTAPAVLASRSDTGVARTVVDNAPTDATAALARHLAATAPFPVHLVREEKRNTGAADTGFRYALTHGPRRLVRTAACLPAADRTAQTRAELARGTQTARGRGLPRRDEQPSPAERHLFPTTPGTIAPHGHHRTGHPRHRTPHMLRHGHPLALTAAPHPRCGGTPHTPLEGPPEDSVLFHRTDEHNDRDTRAEPMAARTGPRRLRTRDAHRTLPQYGGHRCRPTDPKQVHVR
ncbi:glycosyltransferase family 2 protein [Streptomyces sp. YIM B13518]|uniref:glycosyltransferase family 2 protein n=1 Tax=Streptomyces sp. YIM B13518 TaxID=3366316 RepID=UPI0036C7A80F